MIAGKKRIVFLTKSMSDGLTHVIIWNFSNITFGCVMVSKTGSLDDARSNLFGIRVQTDVKFGCERFVKM